MQYWGKLLGVIVAIWAGAGFWGVVLGLIVGHMIDSARSNKRSRGFFTDQQTRQTLFFRTTFQVMGHLTK
ncbi:DnaJ-like protein DjlA [Serratia liquefaciens]|nr:DnaJ-like protein DjlA [Serratia liquefaciens]